MRLTQEDAAEIVKHWPDELTLRERFTLFRQLSSLNLPEADMRQWQKPQQPASK